MAETQDRLKGKVRWFDSRRGFGFITREEGGADLFVHHSSIKAAGFRWLVEDELVEFSVGVGDDGRTRATDVTGPGGASVQCTNYGGRSGGGSCYRCGKMGHLARYCFLRNGDQSVVGPCYSCGAIGHFARDCSSTRVSFGYPLHEIRTGKEDEVKDDVEEILAGEQRNWAELPRDVLSVIFKKIAAIEIIRSAQFVCRSWRHLSHEPDIWRCIDMTGHADLFNEIDLNTLAIEAVRRSSGRLEEFHGEYVGNDELIDYMSDRATLLWRLRLTACHEMYEECLAQALEKFPLLEELELTHCSFSDDVVELVGQACPHLKTFRFNEYPFLLYDDSQSDSELNHDSRALAIAKHMQQLRCLQIFGNMLTNDGLTSILDNCRYLEHLDIRGCLYVTFDENLKKKCARIKILKLPNDSTADCPFDTAPEPADYADYADYAPSLPDSEYDFESSDYGYFDGIDMNYDDFFRHILLLDHLS